MRALPVGPPPQPDNLCGLGQPFIYLLLTAIALLACPSTVVSLFAIFMWTALTACQKWKWWIIPWMSRARMCPPTVPSVLCITQQKDCVLICKIAICNICPKTTSTFQTLLHLEFRFRIIAFCLIFLGSLVMLLSCSLSLSLCPICWIKRATPYYFLWDHGSCTVEYPKSRTPPLSKDSGLTCFSVTLSKLSQQWLF